MKKILALSALTLLAQTAYALPPFDPTNVSGMTNDSVAALIKTAAVGGDHRAYMPASPLGVTLGLDFGIDVTAIKTPQEFIDAMTAISGQPATSVPATVPLPRFNLHKGFPFGVDLGFTYFSYQNLAKMVGVEVKYALIHNPALPAIAARVSGSYLNLWFLQTHTYKIDVVASKNLILFEPYVGTGVQFWSGDLNLPVTVAQGFQANVTGHQSGTTPHFYGGLAFKLLVLKIDAEIDYSTSGILTYGGKLGLAI